MLKRYIYLILACFIGLCANSQTISYPIEPEYPNDPGPIIPIDPIDPSIPIGPPINIGNTNLVYDDSFVFSEIYNTIDYSNLENNVWITLNLLKPMEIVISHCGSELLDTKFYLFGSPLSLIAEVDNCNEGGCNITTQACLKVDLPVGQYILVSRGVNANGNITITIEGNCNDIPDTPDIPSPSIGLSQDRNYILTIIPTVPTATTSELNGNNSMQQVQYFDGLGRFMQAIEINASPNKEDLVTYQEYDNFDRESKSWLPVVASGNNGAFLPFPDFIAKTGVTYPGESKPYSLPVYENSPLNRVLEQYGPGQLWHDNSRSIRSSYRSNFPYNDSLNCAYYTVTDAVNDTLLTLNRIKNYSSGELYVTRLVDEDGNSSYEFKDKQDRVLLTRQIQYNDANSYDLYDTYYIYDDFGNRLMVLPPKASDVFTTNTSWESKTDTILKNYAFLYKYDARNRCIAKKLPGCSWIYYIYDEGNRLIFSQDGEQRIRGEWMFTLPDAFGRPCVNGICMNTDLDPLATKPLSMVVKTVRDNTTAAFKGYSAPNFSLVTPQILNVYYYDDYSFLGKPCIPEFSSTNFDYVPMSDFGDYYISAKGLATGTLTLKLDNSAIASYLGNMMYYDDRSRVVQTISSNHLNGLDKEFVAYNFSGQPLKRQHVHSAAGKSTYTENYIYDYDHAGRLLATTHQLTEVTTGGARVEKPSIILAQNTYDDLGRLSSTTPNNHVDLETTYTYNIRSWIQNISNYHFIERLAYNYNGNIGSQEWEQAMTTRRYTFTYDNLSRLTRAAFTGDGNYGATYAYDKHGNVTSLERYGNSGSTTYGIIDQLAMTYNGNQLKTVEDAAAVPNLSSSADFRNRASLVTEYHYDANGNMIQDLNKGISNITYNSLNLPSSLTISNDLGSATNTYVYTAAGTKLSVTKDEFRTDYVSNVIYEDNVFKRMLVDGGYYADGAYYFYVRDHLGNNRIVADQNANVVQSTQYYPFGMAFADGSGQAVQPYKHSGKELDTDRGLNLYDSSARHSDPALGNRFITMDPLAEKYYPISPYAYCANNPMRFVDLDGREMQIPPTTLPLPIMPPPPYMPNNDVSNIPTTKDISRDLNKLTSRGIENIRRNFVMTALLFDLMISTLVADSQNNSIVDEENSSSQIKDDSKKEANPKREAREKAKEKREAQPASEDYVKYKARQKEKAEGKDARRRSHDEKEKGEPDRSKQRIDDDYNIE